MKKIILIIVCALLNSIDSKAQTILFDSTYDYNHELQFGFDVFQLGDSGYITLNSPLNVQNNNGETLISFYDSLGKRKTNKVYGDSGYQYYIGEWGSMQKTYDGGYAFGGSKLKNSDYSSLAMLMKLNVLGDTEFIKFFGDTTINWQAFFRCIQTYDSGYALIGSQAQNWRDSLTYDNNIYVVRTDKHGNPLWQNSYGANKVDEEGWSILQLQNHHLVLSGTTEISHVYYPLIIETDSAGNAIKQKMLEGSTYTEGGRMVTTYGNGFAEWGNVDTAINSGDYPTAALVNLLDSNYNVKKRIIYNQTNFNLIYQVRQLKDSSFVLVGYLNGADSSYDGGWIAKIGKDGTKEWEHYYTYSKFYNEFADFEQTADKGFIVTGDAYNTSIPNYTQDLWLVKLDSNGCLQPGCSLNIETAEVDIEPESKSINVYPNPALDELTIDVPNNLTPQQITVIDNLGRVVLSVTPLKPKTELNISTLAAGLYFIKTRLSNGSVQVNKFVKQ